MSEELSDEQSHYEISLTAGQAFVAFVLLLLSLAASFAFGLMIGKGQGDERLIVRREPTVVTEAAAIPKRTGRIVELGVPEDFAGAEGSEAATDSSATSPALPDSDAATATAPAASSSSVEVKPSDAPAEQTAAPAETSGPVFAQLFSTADQKAAEALAAKVINGGFPTAWVDRTSNEKGPVFRVRVRFANEADARAAESRLKEFSREVWITRSNS